MAAATDHYYHYYNCDYFYRERGREREGRSISSIGWWSASYACHYLPIQTINHCLFVWPYPIEWNGRTKSLHSDYVIVVVLGHVMLQLFLLGPEEIPSLSLSLSIPLPPTPLKHKPYEARFFYPLLPYGLCKPLEGPHPASQAGLRDQIN